MNSLTLKLIVFLSVAAFSMNGIADEDEPSGMSRRGFLRRLIATGAVAAVPTSVTAAGMSSGTAAAAVPRAVLKKLAALRIDTSYNTLDSGLSTYMKKLRQILAETHSEGLKRLLNAKLARAEDALSVYNNVKAAAHG
jgi:hypothetical protein